jgi:hypothetical protein
MAKQNHEKDVAYGRPRRTVPSAQTRRTRRGPTAIEHGYNDDAAQVAETLRAMLADETSPKSPVQFGVAGPGCVGRRPFTSSATSHELTAPSRPP